MRFKSLPIIPWLILAIAIAADALAFTVSVEPVRLAQGDPFLLIVNSAPAMPEAMFRGRALYFSGCGDGCYVALGAASVDEKPGRHPITVRSEGLSASFSLHVRPGRFPHQSLTLPKHLVELSPEDEARADREEALMRALWPVNTRRLWDGSFPAPIKGEVSTGFGVQRTINKTIHRVHSGLDIKAPQGTEVKAPNNGLVALKGDFFFGGLTVVLDHGMGLYSVFMHMDSIRVRDGEVVLRGQTLGTVGSTGRSTGPHLHYTLKLSGMNINPLAFEALRLPASGAP